MRITPLSTATACTLGVLAVYGVSNRVDGSPQPEAPKQKPVQPSQAETKPQVAATLPLAQTVAPPETFPPSPLEISRDLAKARQQREAKLAQDLAKVTVPKPAQPRISNQPAYSVTSINISDIRRPSVDQIVARSVAPQSVAAQIGATQSAPPQAVAKPKPQSVAPTATPTPVAAVPSAPVPPVAASVPSVAQASAPAMSQPTGSQPALRIEASAQTQPTIAVAAAVAAPAAPVAATPAAQPSPSLVTASAVPSARPSSADPVRAVQHQQEVEVQDTNAAPSEIPLVDRLVAALPDLGIRNKTEASEEPRTAAPEDQAAKNRVAAQSPQPAQTAETAQTAATTPSASPAVARQVAQTSPTVQVVQPVAQSVTQATPAASRPAGTAQATANQPAPGQPIYPSASTVAAPNVDEAYTLGPGDQVSLRFFNAPEYNGDVQVLSDGTLNLPMVGSVSVNGMTLQQAESRVAALYQSELRYSVVTMSLLQPRPLQIAIVGEVQQPGSYTLAAEGGQFPGLIRAIQTAGGTTQAADVRYILVQRSTHNNPNQTIAINLADFVQNGNLSQDLKLRDGDRIIIPTATAIDFNQAAQLSAANFAGTNTQPIDIAVVGEIFRPGAYKMGGEGGRPTVSQAIQMAGGIKPSADVRQIQIRRATRVGVEQVINVDFFQLLQTGNLTQDLVLQQGDRITIPTATAASAADTTLLSAANLSPATMQVNVVGEVKGPGAVQLPPGSTLNQVILAAGGFNNRATREIELIRLEPNGSLTRRTIEVDMKEGFNTANNPLILNNDVVIVGRSGAAQFSDQINQINSVVGPLLQLLPFRLPSPF